MTAPTGGSVVSGSFHVAAQVTSGSPIADVTFFVTASTSGVRVGSLVIPTQTSTTYAGNLILDDKSFGGQASVRAVMHRTGLPDFPSSAVLVTINQGVPTITSTFDGGGQWFAESSTIDVTATVTDQQTVSEVDLVLPDGGFYVATSNGSNLYTAHVPAKDVAPPGGEASVSFDLTATNNAGGKATSKNLSVLQVDDKPPAVSAATLDTAFDGTDSSSQGWFAGPTAIPGGGAIQISAAISDGFLVTTGAGAPAAVVGGTRFAGTLSGARWIFSLPRSIGLNATGPVQVVLDAQDQAGNHPVSPPTFSLQFDDVPVSGFLPAIPADQKWYAVSSGISLTLAVTLPALPRSGLRFAPVLSASGKPDVNCTGAGLSWTCVLPSQYAPAGVEDLFRFVVSAQSITRVSASGQGVRNFDDVPPVITAAAAPPYPAAATGPLSWSHDGSHFNLRDNAALYTFSAFDCGAGLRQDVLPFTIAPALSRTSFSFTPSGAGHACANGSSVTVFNVSVIGDLSSSAAGSFTGADNTFAVGATISDAATNGTAFASHTASANSPTINVTRRIWQTGATTANAVAVGPSIVISSQTSISGMRASDGTTLWNSSASGINSGPAIGGSAAAPVVYFGEGNQALGNNTIFSLNPLTGASGPSCAVTGTPAAPAGCKATAGGQGLAFSNVLSLTNTGAAMLFGTITNNGITTASGDPCGSQLANLGILGSSCTIPGVNTAALATTKSPGGAAVDQLATGRGGKAFFVAHLNDLAGEQSLSASIAEAPIAGGAVVNTSTNTCDDFIMTDSGGNDSPLCDGARYTFGSAFATSWTSVAPLAGTTAPGLDRLFSGANGFALSSGASTSTASGTILAIDASPTRVAYVANGATLTANALGAGGLSAGPWGMPALPGTSILDLAMDKNGNVYVVSSNGQVSAIATDSPGLGTANSGWATRRRDACRSNSLDFTCPF